MPANFAGNPPAYAQDNLQAKSIDDTAPAPHDSKGLFMRILDAIFGSPKVTPPPDSTPPATTKDGKFLARKMGPVGGGIMRNRATGAMPDGGFRANIPLIKPDTRPERIARFNDTGDFVARRNVDTRPVVKFTDIGQVADIKSQHFGSQEDFVDKQIMNDIPLANTFFGVADQLLGGGNAAGLSPQQMQYLANATKNGGDPGRALAIVEGRMGTKQILVNGEYVTVGGRGLGGPGWDNLNDV